MIIEKPLAAQRSRREVLAGSLATGFLLAFHLPVRGRERAGAAAGT